MHMHGKSSSELRSDKYYVKMWTHNRPVNERMFNIVARKLGLGPGLGTPMYSTRIALS